MRIEIGLRWTLLLGALAGCQRAGLPPGGTPAALESACGFAAGADPTRAVLAFSVDHDVKLTFADGATRAVYTFAAAPASPRTSFNVRIVDVEGDRVLVEGDTFEEPIGAPGQWTTELVLLDRAGNLVWRRSAPGLGTPYLGSNGTLAVWNTDQQTLVIGADGIARAVAGLWSPIAPAPDGSLLVQAAPPGGGGDLGWLRPGHSAVEPLAIQPRDFEAWIADRLVYIGKQGAGGDVLVLATPDATRVVDLPGAGAGVELGIGSAAGDWLEVERYRLDTGTDLGPLRVNVRSGAVDAIASQVPAGMRAFNVGLDRAQLADDGSLVAGFRNDYIGHLYRSIDAGASWAPIGLSIANAQGLRLATASGGTFVVQSVQAVYAPDSPWDDPPAGVTPELSGSFLELVRPADGIAYQLPSMAGYDPVALGSGGRCAAYWALGADKKGGRLEVLDVARSRRTIVAELADAGAVNPPFWLER